MRAVIDNRAIIDKSVKIGAGVSIGAYAIVGPNVVIGDGTQILEHSVIRRDTIIGKNNKFFQFSSVGEDPQDKKYHHENTLLEIGDNNHFREFCTIHRGTVQDKGKTKIGNNNLFMNYVHVAHDCVVCDNTIFSNNASLAGHVTVSDNVVLGAFSAVYQFCHLGEYAFITGGSLVIKDVLPYIKVAGHGEYARPVGLNSIGLTRNGFTQEKINQLKEAYRIIYRQGLTAEEAINKLQALISVDFPEVNKLIAVLQNAKHGIVR